MSTLLLLLITLCVLLLATLYIRFRNSVPKSNRKVWNRKDTSSLENTLQKIIGKNMTSYIVDTSSQRENTWSPYVPPNRYNNNNASNYGTVLEQNGVNQQQPQQPEGTSNAEFSNYNNTSTLYPQQQNTTQQVLNASTIPISSQSTILSIQPNINPETSNKLIYRNPTIDRLDKKPIYTSPHNSKKPSTPHSSASKKKIIYFDNSRFLDGVGVSPILPDKKLREEPSMPLPNSSFINQSSIVLEPILEMETKPEETKMNTSEGETTGMLADASMISVGDNKKSPKGILRRRNSLGNFASQPMNLSAQLNDSEILNSSTLRKKKVEFDQAVKNQNLKRSRPLGFEKSAPPPSETSFSRENQKRTKTADIVMANSSITPILESPKPTKPLVILPEPPNVSDSMISESEQDKNESIILDCKFSVTKPKKKIGGRIGFSTPSTLRNQKILRYGEDIQQRKELAFYLLKGEPSPEKKKDSTQSNKTDDSNLGSSFNLSSLAKRSTDTVSYEQPKPTPAAATESSSSSSSGFTFTIGSSEKKNEETNSNFVIPTTTETKPTQEPTKVTTSGNNDSTKQIPAGLDLSAFKQPEPKPRTENAQPQPTIKPTSEPSTKPSTKPSTSSLTLNIPSTSNIEPAKVESDTNPFASVVIPSTSKTETTSSNNNETANPFANLKLATPTEQPKSVFNPFAANTSSSNIFGTPSSTKNAFTKTTPSRSADRVSDFAKMDSSIFQRDTLSFGTHQ